MKKAALKLHFFRILKEHVFPIVGEKRIFQKPRRRNFLVAVPFSFFFWTRSMCYDKSLRERWNVGAFRILNWARNIRLINLEAADSARVVVTSAIAPGGTFHPHGGPYSFFTSYSSPRSRYWKRQSNNLLRTPLADPFNNPPFYRANRVTNFPK